MIPQQKIPTEAQASWLRSAQETPGRTIGRPGRRTYDAMAAAGWVSPIEDARVAGAHPGFMRITSEGLAALAAWRARQLGRGTR